MGRASDIQDADRFSVIRYDPGFYSGDFRHFLRFSRISPYQTSENRQKILPLVFPADCPSIRIARLLAI